MRYPKIYQILSLLVLTSMILSACSVPLPTPTAPPTEIAIKPTVTDITFPTNTPRPTATAARPTDTAAPVTPTEQPTLPPYTPPAEVEGAPQVIQRVPARGAELAVDGAIELVFDRAVDRASLESNFTIEPAVKGAFQWRDDRTMRFVPDANWKRDTRYEVTARLGDTDRSSDDTGRYPHSDYRFKFRTVGYLEVTQVVPAADSADVETDSTITVMFNRPVVPLTALGERYGDNALGRYPHSDLLTFDPPVEGAGEWLNTSVYVFEPDPALAGGTRYTARVAAGLTDTTGGLLAEDYEWSFTTYPPEVVWVSPREGAELVSPKAAISVNFNQPIDPASAETAFSLTSGRLSRAVEGEFEFYTNTLTFTPTQMLDFDTTYRVVVKSGVTSASGGEGMRADYEWRFTTVPLPQIISTEPRNGENNAEPYTSFIINFNAPIDPTTVMPNIKMTPPLSPTQVYTYFNTWNNSFVINFGAKPSTKYEVKIASNIADPYGNKTGQKMTVRFRTRELDPMVRLHVPGQTSTYNASEPARLYAAYINTSRLNFKLYRFDLEEFMRARRDWWAYQPSGKPIRQWTERVEAPQNEREYARVELADDGGALEPGFYMVEVDSPDVRRDNWGQRHLLVVTKINLTLKIAAQEVLVWATDLASGRPVADLDLELRDGENTRYGTATTDADGLARFEIEERHRYDYFAFSDEPFTLGSGEWSQGISPWDFGFDSEYGAAEYRWHIYTDREIYRAGQTVHFRGIVRAEDDVSYTLPDNYRVTVRIYDAAGEEVYNEQLTLDDFGTFYGDLELSEGAALGQYNIQAEFANYGYGASFQVAAYRPPEFEVTVNPADAEVLMGDSTQAAVDVTYFFGGPVVDAPVSWNVMLQTYRFAPPQFARYKFTDTDDPWICWNCWWWQPEPPRVILSGEGRTDAAGKLMIDLPHLGRYGDNALGRYPDSDIITGSHKLIVEATATGADNQVLSGRSEIIVHRGEFYIGLAPQQYVGQAEREMNVDVISVDLNGARLPSRKLTATVYRREWENIFIENEAGGGRWEWETKDTEVHREEISTDANAEAVITFTPAQGGSYRVVVNGLDEGERLVQSSIFVWVSGRDYVSWRRENNDRITLVADKGKYAPGETAEILIPSPFSGEQWVLLTIERGGILHREVMKLENNSYIYRLPITADHAPNIYVSAVVVKGQDENNEIATYKVGYVGLEVEPVPQTLNIEATPDRDRAEPGETMGFDLRVTDDSGEPVSAAFSLDLVDKAILTLMPRQPDAIVKAFYSRRGLGVNTASGLAVSLNRLLVEQEEQYEEVATFAGADNAVEKTVEVEEEMAMEAPAAPMATEGAVRSAAKGEAAAPPPGVELREEFADTAYWDAAVVTGQDGRARVEIELPDNLTTWVFRGVGITADTEVGEATTEMRVTKPLLVRPVAPRFFVVEDRAELAALVNNNTDRDLETEIELSSSGLELQSEAKQVVNIPADGEVKVTWDVVVQDVEHVELIFSAVSPPSTSPPLAGGTEGGYADAARPRLTTGPDGTLMVYRYTAPEVVGTAGQVEAEDTRTEIIALPPKYDERRGYLSVQLDPSLAAGMRDGLDYLEHFPYECTEQLVSRFLPNVLTYRALQRLNLVDPELEEKLESLVYEALLKLLLMQHDDGGWGWWYDDESNPHLTAYVIFGLAKARETDFPVDQQAIERGLAYLDGQLVSGRELRSYREANRQAFILYAMAEAGRAKRASAHVDDLFENRERLSHYGKAYLAMTLDMIDVGDSRIKTLLSDLNNAAILSATGAHWEEENYDWWAMNTDTRSTAVILDALAKLDPENALNPNVVRWLMVARQDGIWETTQETAWALIALTDWMEMTGELAGEYDYAVTLNDGELASGAVNAENIDESVKLRVAVRDLLRDQGNLLQIWRGAGDGRLYYTAHLKMYLPVEEIEPANRGIIVQRQYCTLTPDPSPEGRGEICEEVREVKVGDTVQVRLTIIAPHDLYYVMVEDPLPAGAEAIDTNLATTSMLEQDPTLRREPDRNYWWGWWWWNWYSRTEMRDEKVVLFADRLAKGTYEYTYTFRATLPGEYRVMPTFANEMYFPEVFGRSAGRLLVIGE